MISVNYKKLTISGLSIIFLLLSIVSSARATYVFKDESGIRTTANEAGYDITAGATTVEGVIAQVIFAGLSLVGIAFMGFLIYGGITWMTARDNEEKVKKANAIIMSSLIGLIVTLSAYVLTYFLIQYFSFTPVEPVPTQY